METIPPTKNRCLIKLGEIQKLKQKEQHTAEELEKIGKEGYYQKIMDQVYNPNLRHVQTPVVTAHAVAPITIGENSVMVKCNYGSDVYKHIETGKRYVIEMPHIHTIVHVTCSLAACRAADMFIEKSFVNGQRDHSSEECTVSYNYDNYDSIYYTSFNYADACNVYMFNE